MPETRLGVRAAEAPVSGHTADTYSADQALVSLVTVNGH